MSAENPRRPDNSGDRRKRQRAGGTDRPSSPLGPENRIHAKEVGGNNSRENPYSSEIKGYISRMEELMQEPQYNHAGMPTQLGIDLWLAGKIDSFAAFEDCLRDLDSRVHLLAVPTDFFGDQYETVYPIPEKSTEKPDHTLYVAVNGAGEAAQMRKQLDLTPEENRNRLKKAGVLIQLEM